MKITKLEYQKKDPSRVSVYIDGEFAVGVSADDILNLKIYKDKEISQGELTNILAQSEFGKVFNFAINFLSFRPRSEWEVRFRLHKKTKDESLINNVIEKLIRVNLVDDNVFAKWFLEQRKTFRPKGKIALKAELLKKGIDKKIIDEVLKDERDDEQTALDLVRIKFKKDFDRVKIQRFLLSRGFNWETVNSVVAKLLKTNYNDGEEYG